MEVGRRIKAIRLELGMTMEEFGGLFNATKGNVNQWEKGINNPNPERLRRMAEIGNISVQFLLHGEKETEVTLSIAEYNRLKDIEKKYQQLSEIFKAGD